MKIEEIFARSKTPIKNNNIRFLFILFSPFFLGGFLLFWCIVLIDEIFSIEIGTRIIGFSYIVFWRFLGFKYFD